jgi:nucleotide-binding universal stress UspA family protein
MPTVKKILVPLDFSATSTQVLDFARLLADACRASLDVVHVVGVPLDKPERSGEEQRNARRRLEALLDQTDRDRRRATVSCLVGAPGDEIVRHATDHAIDLIVMGTHSHGPTFQMVIGSVAEHVVRRAPCAVLTVKDAGRRQSE